MPSLSAKKLFRHLSDLQRPWLHHLNGDTSWLLQLPLPESASNAFFNILIDPWLENPNIEGHALFHSQLHTTPSAVRTIAELEDFLRDVEKVATKLRGHEDASPPSPSPESERKGSSLLDAVAITLDLNDHCNKDCLLEVHPGVPVYALKRAANMIRAFKHFDEVHTIPFHTAGANWQGASIRLGPSDTGFMITGLRQAERDNRAHLFYGFVITFPTTCTSEVRERQGRQDSPLALPQSQQDVVPPHQALVYLPHGVHTKDLAHLAAAKPAIRYLALVHGLHMVSFGLPFGGWNFDSNMGAHDALKTQRLLDAKYWFGTHDELKETSGFTSWFEMRKVVGFQDAIEHSLGRDEVEKAPIGTLWRELGCGESMLLVP